MFQTLDLTSHLALWLAFTWLMYHMANGGEIESSFKISVSSFQAANVVGTKLVSLLRLDSWIIKCKIKKRPKMQSYLFAWNAEPWITKHIRLRVCRHTAAYYLAHLRPTMDVPVEKVLSSVSKWEKEGLVRLCACLQFWLQQVSDFDATVVFIGTPWKATIIFVLLRCTNLLKACFSSTFSPLWREGVLWHL